MSEGINRGPLVAAVGGLVLALLVGLRITDAVLVGVAVLVISMVGVSLAEGARYHWPEGRYEESDGTRSEIAALTWSFVGREGQVAEGAVRRLRAVATRRLARRGVVLTGGLGPPTADRPHDAQAARARELLGERAWGALTSSGGWLPSLGDIAHCVDMIERLGPRDPASDRTDTTSPPQTSPAQTSPAQASPPQTSPPQTRSRPTERPHP